VTRLLHDGLGRVAGVEFTQSPAASGVAALYELGLLTRQEARLALSEIGYPILDGDDTVGPPDKEKP
jgi:hypothetical protein